VRVNGVKPTIYFSKIATGKKNSEIGSYFGVSPQTITNILTKVENEIQESDELKKEIDYHGNKKTEN